MTEDSIEHQDKTAMSSDTLSGAGNQPEPELFEPVLVPNSGSVEQLGPKPDEHASEDWFETPSEAIPQPPAADGEMVNSSGGDSVSKSELAAARIRIDCIGMLSSLQFRLIHNNDIILFAAMKGSSYATSSR